MVTVHTLMVVSEAYPLAKSGGLGDAVTGMATALRRSGTGVDVLLPAYRGLLERLVEPRLVARLSGLPGGESLLYRGTCPETGLDILALSNDTLYDRPGLYVDDEGQDYPDNAWRYAALAHAAVRICLGLPGERRPDVVHAHDWHAGLVPLLVRAVGLRYVKTVYTIHNLAFQGQFPLGLARELGVPADYCGPDGVASGDRLSFMKAGILHADRITTVSETYAREILTPRFGCGLDALLRSREADLHAVPNGIDDTLWNPEHDPALGRHRYSAANLRNKRRCKTALRRDFGLADALDGPVLAMGSRLTEQKMADVAVAALPEVLQAHPDLQVVVLGRGDPRLERALREVARNFPGRCAVRIGYDEATAHRLHAGSDMLLHGSRFEPFGLTPLYAMRYGSVPVGSRVGGMADTIRDPGDVAGIDTANGILFDGDSPQAMIDAIARAVALFRTPQRWRTLQRNGMTGDFSWRTSVRHYQELYESLASWPSAERVPATRVRPASRPAADLQPAALHATA
ncbi:glycogen synthase GlgA [Bordetella sp. 2513F-2]